MLVKDLPHSHLFGKLWKPRELFELFPRNAPAQQGLEKSEGVVDRLGMINKKEREKELEGSKKEGKKL